MADGLLESVMGASKNLGKALSLGDAVFDFSMRDFVPGAQSDFCARCSYGACQSRTAHTYGSFEAERWKGLYVYYCPASLAFTSSVVFSGSTAAYAIILGPMVMGQLEDMGTLGELPGVKALARRTPEAVNALAQVQWSVAMFLSGRDAHEKEAQVGLHNALYELTERMKSGEGARYPIELERRLQRMIMKGDKEGARELINELLGALYFDTVGDLDSIKARARELLVLFSRASIDGGADAGRIFGQTGEVMARLECAATLDELSEILTQVFYRFVGYVFDFGAFEHADIMQKAVNYLRAHLSERVTLEELAKHVALSRSYLSTIFKAELGRSFTDFLNEIRLEKSKELLTKADLSIAEIADLVGYSDQSHFTRKFAQSTGMSPGQYRKRGGRVNT